MKCILGLSALAGVLLLATTAAAERPQIDELWRPPPSHATKKVDKRVLQHRSKRVVHEQQSTTARRPMLRRRQVGDMFDDYSRVRRTPSNRTTKSSRVSKADKKKLRQILESKLKQTVRCGDHSDCGMTVPRSYRSESRDKSDKGGYSYKREKMQNERFRKMLLLEQVGCMDKDCWM